MRKVFILFLMTFVFQQVHAEDTGMKNQKNACFQYMATIPHDVTYIQSAYDDIVAEQDGKRISISNIDSGFGLIPYSANVWTQKAGGINDNRYQFSPLDTDTGNEIILTFEKNLKKDTFYVLTQFEADYYTPEYYISENGDIFSRVGVNDISDYDVKKIKIIFKQFRDTNTPIREVIKKIDIRIINNYHSYELETNGKKDIIIYSDNRCTLEPQIYGELNHGDIKYKAIRHDPNIAFHIPIFSENPKYSSLTSDQDNDGISDLEDNCISLSNALQKDKNQNGIGDACEFDSDSDGIPDQIDNCRNIPNPEQKDSDNDRIGNLCDNCRLYNPTQVDKDKNNIGDTCDLQDIFLKNNDQDSDGIVDFTDNCKSIANSDQQDSDNDGVGDVCDNCKTYQNPEQEDENKNGIGDICEDSDKDGIDGLRDNCRNVANPDQADDDNDGIGNVCEDNDRDSVIFSIDNCPYKYNPKQIDTDSDGVGDACDETDNRFIESNKTIFIFLMLLITTAFMGGIFFLGKQIQKKS